MPRLPPCARRQYQGSGCSSELRLFATTRAITAQTRLRHSALLIRRGLTTRAPSIVFLRSVLLSSAESVSEDLDRGSVERVVLQPDQWHSRIMALTDSKREFNLETVWSDEALISVGVNTRGPTLHCWRKNYSGRGDPLLCSEEPFVDPVKSLWSVGLQVRRREARSRRCTGATRHVGSAGG